MVTVLYPKLEKSQSRQGGNVVAVLQMVNKKNRKDFTEQVSLKLVINLLRGAGRSICPFMYHRVGTSPVPIIFLLAKTVPVNSILEKEMIREMTKEFRFLTVW